MSVRRAASATVTAWLVVALVGTPLRAPADVAAIGPGTGAPTATRVPDDAGIWVPEMSIGSGEVDPTSLHMDLADLARESGVVTWRARTGAAWEIRASVRTGPRSWGPVETVSTPGLVAETPYANVSGDRLAVITWRAYDGAHWRIQAAVNESGTGWSDPVTLSQPGSDAATPIATIVEWGTGELEPRVVWRQSTGASWQLVFARLSPDGQVTRSAKTVTTPGQDVRDLSLEVDGDYAVWSQFDGRNWRLRTGDIAFLQQEGTGNLITPPDEDVVAPRMVSTASTSAFVWLGPDGANRRVRALPSSCDPICLGNEPRRPRPVDVSLPGFEVEAASVQRGLITDFQDVLYKEYDAYFWRQFDGNNWRVATRTKVDGHSFGDVEYISTPGVDASAPVSDSGFDYPYGWSVVVGWMEGTAGQAVARAATILPGPDPVTTTASLSGVGTAVSRVTVDQGGLLGPGVAWVTEGTVAHVTMRGLDVTPPLLDVRLPEFHRDTTLNVSWRAMDDWSPIDVYEYRYKLMRWNRQGATRTPWRSTAAPFSVKRVRNGNSYCVFVRATDVVGRRTVDRAGSCTTTPIDDRVLEHRGGWTARRGSGYFNDTFLETHNRGATLALPRLPVKRNIYLMLGVGPGYGRVRVESDGMTGVVDLDRKRAKTIKVALGLELRGPVRVTVVSAGKKVRVDGALAQPAKLHRCEC